MNDYYCLECSTCLRVTPLYATAQTCCGQRMVAVDARPERVPGVCTARWNCADRAQWKSHEAVCARRQQALQAFYDELFQVKRRVLATRAVSVSTTPTTGEIE